MSIEIEFTEGALIRNPTHVLRQLHAIRSLGVDLAIDDFGTGYSSVSYLHKLPASVLKIDQSFMLELHENRRDQMLVQAIIGMAHQLGYRVVAEGVETKAIYDFLAASGCNEVQGYYFSRPLEACALEGFVQESSASTANKSCVEVLGSPSDLEQLRKQLAKKIPKPTSVEMSQ